MLVQVKNLASVWDERATSHRAGQTQLVARPIGRKAVEDITASPDFQNKVVKIQSLVRATNARKVFAQKKQDAENQKLVQKKAVEKSSGAIVKIQAMAKGMVTRLRHRRMREGVTKIQANWRRFQVAKKKKKKERPYIFSFDEAT